MKAKSKRNNLSWGMFKGLYKNTRYVRCVGCVLEHFTITITTYFILFRAKLEPNFWRAAAYQVTRYQVLRSFCFVRTDKKSMPCWLLVLGVYQAHAKISKATCHRQQNTCEEKGCLHHSWSATLLILLLYYSSTSSDLWIGRRWSLL